MASRLDPRLFRKVERPADAEAIVVNTCCFIEDARRESVDEILEMAEWRKGGACLCLAVVGCMVQRYGSALANLFPEVDLWLDLAGEGDLGEALASRLRKALTSSGEGAARSVCSTQGTGTAYLKIAEGCGGRCTFCVIPSLRGPLKSRRLKEIEAEARFLTELGVKELVLVAQDSTAYGADLYGATRLPQLLGRLCRLPGDWRIRVMYAQPRGVSPDMLRAMRHPRVCSYLDIPLQHASREILKGMGRGGDRAAHLRLLRRIREALPGVALRTTCIVGFPGETRREFAELEEFVKEARFDWLGVFGYSREQGTAAYSRGPGARKDVIAARIRRINDIQDEIMLERACEQVGKTLQVLVERRSETFEGCMEGRSEREAPEVDGLVYVRGRAKAGRIYPVRIEGTEGIDVIGRVIGTGNRQRSGSAAL
jgi:ribosomal protein S12 methylthiotransferase